MFNLLLLTTKYIIYELNNILISILLIQQPQ